MKVNVHIERLVFDGIDVPPGQRPLLQASVETELARLLMKGGATPERAPGAAKPDVSSTAIPLQVRQEVIRLGGRIAEAVHDGIYT